MFGNVFGGSGNTRYRNLSGLGNSQRGMLNAQTAEFGDYGTSMTNESLASNPNLQGSSGGGFNMGNAIGLAQMGKGLMDSWLGFEQLGLAKNAFKYNKEMKDKEYAMAKDAYDRNVARSNSIAESYNKGPRIAG